MQIEDYLYMKDMHFPFLGQKPTDMKDKEWALLDKQALGVIQLTLSCNVAFNIMKKKTMASLMVVLSDMNKKSFASNKVHFMRLLFNL